VGWIATATPRKLAATTIQQISVHSNGKSMPYSIGSFHNWQSVPIFGTSTVHAAERSVAQPTTVT
jgi:hypothetical protein